MKILNNLEDYKDKYVVYLLTSPSGKRYCGYSSNIKRRWHGPSQYKECKGIYSAINKYGWDNIQARILYSFDSAQQALKKEAEIIEQYDLLNPEKGYNLVPGGGDPPHNINLVSQQGLKAMRENGKRLAKQVWENDQNRKICIEAMKRGNQEWLKNSTVEQRKKRYGEHNIGRSPINVKSIYQLDKNTYEILNQFPSASEAARSLGDQKYSSNIRRTAAGNSQTAYGYRWVWKEDYQKGIKRK